MINLVQNFIKKNNLEGKTVLVGLSGGVDSSVLCYILSGIKNIKLIAIHLNHNWRGEESKKDEEFSKKIAENLKIGFYSETLSDVVKKNETSAREARYKFFEKCKKKFNAQAVFLAHNKNDNVETLIYRLIKGTGPSGISSISSIRDFYYRPLLSVSREEIEKFAKENNINFVTDKSNFDTKYKRNLIREKIIPLMKEINPAAIDSIANFIELNNMNQKITNEVIENSLKKIIKENKIQRDKFLNLKIEIQYEIINRYLKEILKTRDFKTIKKIISFIHNNISSQISINSEFFLKIYDNRIYLTKKEKIKPPEEQILVEGRNSFSDYEILVEKTSLPLKFSSNRYLNLDFKNKYILRTRKEGDKFQPFASFTLQKLKTFLIKKKIPLENRDKIPVIALDDEILYIFDVAMSEKLRVDINQKKCYKITIKRNCD